MYRVGMLYLILIDINLLDGHYLISYILQILKKTSSIRDQDQRSWFLVLHNSDSTKAKAHWKNCQFYAFTFFYKNTPTLWPLCGLPLVDLPAQNCLSPYLPVLRDWMPADCYVRYHSVFFAPVGHESLHATIGIKHFFHYIYHVTKFWISKSLFFIIINHWNLSDFFPVKNT